MATFKTRERKDGSTSILAQIIRRTPKVQESKTFTTLKAAQKWAVMREKEIERDITAGREPVKRKVKSVTLGDAIDRYIGESTKEMGKTKAQVLRTIRTEYAIADKPCADITAPDIVQFAREVEARPGVSSPATVANYVAHLSAVFSIARPLWGMQLDQQAMKDAQTVCGKMGYTAKAAKRERRPTLDELNRLLTFFEAKIAHRPKSCPMHKIVVFAIFSTRRQDEICRITWADYEPDHARVLVRDMKHPGDKKGNDTWCELPPPCDAIIEAMPRASERIFPYTADALSAAFTRACKALEIEDLHFHDLRHEGASRLFEMGRTIPQAMSVTGHRSWGSLQRYSHLRQTGDKFAGWPWIDRVTGQP